MVGKPGVTVHIVSMDGKSLEKLIIPNTAGKTDKDIAYDIGYLLESKAGAVSIKENYTVDPYRRTGQDEEESE